MVLFLQNIFYRIYQGWIDKLIKHDLSDEWIDKFIIMIYQEWIDKLIKHDISGMD